MTTSRSDLRKRGSLSHTRWFVICTLFGYLLADVYEIAFADQFKKVVTVSPLENLYIYPLRDAPAKTISLNDAQISAQTAGVIRSIKVNVGDNVETGDLMALLDCEEYEVSLESAKAELDAAKAKLRFAKSQLDTANVLSSKKNIAQEQLNKRRSDFAVAKAEVDRLKASLKNTRRMVNHCQLRAPFSGVIVERIASIGDYAVTGSPIVRLLDNRNIEVSANVQEQDFSSLREAEKLAFFNRQDKFDVKLRTILPHMESKVRSFQVRLSFYDRLAPPGTTGRLQWRTRRPYISSEYFVQRKRNLGIFFLADGAARFFAISGAQKGRPAAVGLPRTTPVILDGRHSLNDGDAVRIVQSGSS